jgi:hypothetical protein
LEMIRAPTAGPTQAERLFPATKATARKTKITSRMSSINAVSLKD